MSEGQTAYIPQRESTDDTTELKQFWETSFTNPEQFDPNKFCFLIHALNNPEETRLIFYDYLRDLDVYDPEQDIDLFMNPEKIGDKRIVCTSVIDQDHLASFSPAGLIVQAGFENVLTMSTKDRVTIRQTPEQIINEVLSGNNRTLMNVPDLLKNTNGRGWNEIVLRNLENERVKIQAGFYFVSNQTGKPLDNYLAQKILHTCENLQLPVIEIPKNELANKEQPIVVLMRPNNPEKLKGIRFGLDGYQYLVEGTKWATGKKDEAGEFITISSLEFIVALKRKLIKVLSNKEKIVHIVTGKEIPSHEFIALVKRELRSSH